MSTCLPAYLCVMLISHAYTVQDVKIIFYTVRYSDVAIVNCCQTLYPRIYGFTSNQCVKESYAPLESEIMTSNLS